MDMRLAREQAVDRLLAAFNLGMALAWGIAARAGPAAAWMCAAHLTAATLPLLLARAGRMSVAVAVLRHAYPIAWLAAFWTEIDMLRRALHGAANDELIRRLDTALFGSALHTRFMPELPSLWISEPLHFAYFAYYAAIALPLVALFAQRRYGHLADAYFRLLLTYVVCFTLYAIFPVDGPHHLEGIYTGRPADGVWYRIVHAVNDSGGSLGAAFPSSHAAGAVTIACLGWLYFSRRVALLLSVHAAAVVLATFYTQYHYAIDSLAGLLLALGLQVLVAPVLLARRAPDRPYDPRLPVMPRCAWDIQAEGGLP